MGMSGLGTFFLISIFIIASACASWVIYTHIRARRLGLPQPSLSSYNPFRARDIYGAPIPTHGGVVGWVNDKIRSFKNRNNRQAGGAYEEPLSSNVRGRASNRGFGPLDPDEAWDTRVGTEADSYGPGGYYEEQELRLHPAPEVSPAYEGTRDRSGTIVAEPYIGGTQAGLDRRYNEEMSRPAENPFGENAESSNLRGVSPRPIDTSGEHRPQDSAGSRISRTSMFRENVAV